MPPQIEPYDPTEIQHHTIPTFTFTNGTTLPNLRVAYRSYNSQSTHGTVLIPTCFGGHINNTLTFRSAPNDVLGKYHVVVAAMLGNGESDGPSNKALFPRPGELRYEDVVRAHYEMLTKGLGVEELVAVIGFSMGGQQSYHWPILYPNYTKSIVSICSSARTSPHNYVFLEGPITTLTTSSDYKIWKEAHEAQVSRGESPDKSLVELKPVLGIAGFARTYAAWLTSAEWFRERIWKHTLGFPSISAYLDFEGESELGWDADNLLVLARMWQMADIGQTYAGHKTELGCGNTMTASGDRDFQTALSEGIKCPVLLMPCRTDQYFRPEDNEYEMKFLKHGRLEVIESIWGHVSGGGGCEEDLQFMNDKIGEFLKG